MTSRREVMQGLTTGAALLAGASSLQAQQAQAVSPAFGEVAQVKPLAFDPAAIDGLSERLLVSHWDNNYRGSVNALNEIKRRIREALDDDTLPAYLYNDMKREHLMRHGSVVLHELYFDNIGPTARDSALDAELTRAFGRVQTWEKNSAASAPAWAAVPAG